MRFESTAKTSRQYITETNNMSDKYLMEGHKLYWHLDRVLAWQRGEKIAPLHIDVGLSKGCNIRCEYCYGALQGNLYKDGVKIYFPREPLLEYVRDAGEAGVASMGLIGEAEPLINPHVYEAIVAGSCAGVDMSLATNGVLFDTGRDGEEALEHLIWIRFNISAASHEAYQRIHSTEDFETVVEKIRFCVDVKRKRNLDITIGMQMVLTPNNVDQVVDLARLGRELGVDYLVVKHCSDTVDNEIGYYNRLGEYCGFTDILKDAESQATDQYDVTIKWGKITNCGERQYDQCLGVPFLLYSSGDGKLFPCGMFFSYKADEYCMGDLTKQRFTDIIQSDRYWDVVERIKQIDVHSKCYSNCRTHRINEFLWQLANPPKHVNFV